MSDASAPIHVTWAELDRLVATLATALADAECDVLLAVSRGGLVPAGMLAYRLGIREIHVAAVALYDDTGAIGQAPKILAFPDAAILAGRRVLVVDEVWETGTTAVAVAARVRAAGGTPILAVLHYKPGRSRHAAVPDHYAATAHGWVLYPFKAGR